MNKTVAKPNLTPVRQFKPYPAYKDSGVEWLGQVPAHWEVKRTKFTARLRSGHTPSRQHPEYWQDCTIPWFGLADVWQIRDGQAEYVSETAEKISELGLANSAARLLPKGTVILSRTASVGFSAIMGTDMATTQDFVNWVCGPTLKPEYLLYVFRSMQHEFRRMTMGSTHQTIYMPDVGRLSTPIPPLREQERIVEFVRRHYRRIDALMAKKEQLIEFLDEKRTALITRAVTKGLDPNVSMKDSGISWLGQIPAHWEVRRIAMAAIKITNGYVGPTRDVLVNEGVRYLQSLHIKEGSIDFERRPYFVRPEWSHQHEKSVLDEGDVLIVQTGDIGQVAVVPKEFAGCNCHALIIIRLRRSLGIGAWLARALESDYGRGALEWSQTGALHPHLECGHVREIRVAFPPRSEQVFISQKLTNALGEVDEMMSKVRSAIDRLKEFRTALVSGAVTGKIDVREHVT